MIRIMSDEKLSLNSYQKENFCVFDGENCNEKNGLGICHQLSFKNQTVQTRAAFHLGSFDLFW